MINNLFFIYLFFFFGDIYLSSGISLSDLVFFVLYSTVSELCCGAVLGAFVIVSAIVLQF